MKRILSFLLIVAFVLSFAACTDPNSPQVPPTEQDRVRLIVLAGQSGARGKALVGDLSKDEREENVDVEIFADGLPMGELGSIPGIDEDVYFEPLEPGYGDFPSEFGPEIGMGQTLASAYPKFDDEYKTVIVKYTASGSTFTDHWYSSSAIEDSSISAHLNLDQVSETDKGQQTGPLTANLYALIERAIVELEELGYQVTVDGMAFIHGEQDAKFDDNMLIYEKALTHFIKDFRSYFGISDLPVVITEALTNSAKYSNQLREIQENVAKSLDRVSLIKTNDLYTNTFEPWHFGAQSNNVLGNKIAAEIVSYDETRVIEGIDQEVIDVPCGVQIDLPQYVKANFTNSYSGYIKVIDYSRYDYNKLGVQDVTLKVNDAEGVKEFTIKVNVSDKAAYVDGNMVEYTKIQGISLPEELGELFVIKGEKGLYIAADILDREIWTDGENWNVGDMGQHGNNDDFIIYLTDSDAASRKTICLSSANLLRIYGDGVTFESDDLTLKLGNMVYNKKVSDYKFHVTTNGLANCKQSNGLSIEFFISYEELGIEDPEAIMLCFNYNDISMEDGVKVGTDNYFVKNALPDDSEENPEENINSYFSINDLSN